MKAQTGKKPLISVIVPVYNGEKYLRSCIECIANQTWSNLETLVINDGSTDETERVCRELEQEYKQVTILNLEDKGVSAARNLGLNHATGEYVTFVDADDRIAQNMIELLYRDLILHDSDIAGCSFFTWKNEKELTSGMRNVNPEFRCNKYSGQRYLEEEILKGNSRCWSKLYKRTAIGEVRFRENLTIGEDMLFLIDLLPRVKKVLECDVRGYGYYQNPNGAMNRAFKSQYMDQITCWEQAELAASKMDEPLSDQNIMLVRSHLITGIMLTVGKLAQLSSADRRQYREYITTCHAKLREAINHKEALNHLPDGYYMKAKLFAMMPGLYLWLYHLLKNVKS